MRVANDTDELAEICSGWNDEDAEQFAQIVSDCLRLTKISERALADEFECDIKTASRWASGVIRPRPRMQKLIVFFIRKLALSHGVLAKLDKNEIRAWLEDGIRREATHMFIVYDADLKEVYHPFTDRGENPFERYRFYHAQSMHCVIAVYSLRRDIEVQLSEANPRCFH